MPKVSALLTRRLAAHALSARMPSVVEACRRLGAMQAQDLAHARWALGVRTEGATIDAVERAFASGSIVRTWPMRGTLHVVPSEDAAWMTRLFRRRNLARAARRLRETEIGARDLEVARRIVENALRGGRKPREALFAELARAGQRVDRQRGVHLLWHLAQEGLVALAGDQFVWLSDLVRRPRAIDGDEALGELAARYRRGHGPATIDDFAVWSGLSKTEAKRATEIAGEEEEDEGSPAPSALLLPGFDEYHLGYADRSHCIEPRYEERIVPGGNGVFQPMVVLDGRVRGTWRRQVSRDAALVTISPFDKITARQADAVEQRANEYAAFLGRAARVVFAPPTDAGPPERKGR